MHPHRVHAHAKPGAALCGAELDRAPVRCALCTLLAHGSEPVARSDIRESLEADCVEYDEPLPPRLAALTGADLDTDPDSQHEAVRALGALNEVIVGTYVEIEHAVRALGLVPGSTRAARARTHLLETLVALNESLRGHDYAEQALRHGAP